MTESEYFLEIVDYALSIAYKIDCENDVVSDDVVNILALIINHINLLDIGAKDKAKYYLYRNHIERVLYLCNEEKRAP